MVWRRAQEVIFKTTTKWGYRVAGGEVEFSSRRMASLLLLFQLRLGSLLKPSLALSKVGLWLDSAVIGEGYWLVTYTT